MKIKKTIGSSVLLLTGLFFLMVNCPGIISPQGTTSTTSTTINPGPYLILGEVYDNTGDPAGTGIIVTLMDKDGTIIDDTSTDNGKFSFYADAQYLDSRLILKTADSGFEDTSTLVLKMSDNYTRLNLESPPVIWNKLDAISGHTFPSQIGISGTLMLSYDENLPDIETGLLNNGARLNGGYFEIGPGETKTIAYHGGESNSWHFYYDIEYSTVDVSTNVSIDIIMDGRQYNHDRTFADILLPASSDRTIISYDQIGDASVGSGGYTAVDIKNNDTLGSLYIYDFKVLRHPRGMSYHQGYWYYMATTRKSIVFAGLMEVVKNSGSISCWIKPEWSSVDSTADHTIMGHSHSYLDDFRFYWNGNDKEWVFKYNDVEVSSTNGSPVVDEWMHVALSWDVSADETMAIYINNQKVAASTDVYTFNQPTMYNLLLGLANVTIDTYESADALFDNLKVWDYKKKDFSEYLCE